MLKRISRTTVFLSLIFPGIFYTSAFSLELYTLIHSDCESQTGLIINVDESAVYQLDISGKLVSTPRKGIEHILVYNTIDNPYLELQLTGNLRNYLREVQVSTKEEERFLGWPIRFFENYIVFFDLEGKTHLVDKDTIDRFNAAEAPIPEKKKLSDYKEYQFGFGNNLPECAKKAGKPNVEIQPTRMLSDQINIHKFLAIYYQGFVKLRRFQRRTIYYARPYLFDKKTKIALVIAREDFQEEFSAGMPIYFQWPSGSTFGPQGFLIAGLKPNENLPSVEPVFGLRFDGKYHFLSASFAGNPFAFSASSGFMIENRFFMGGFFAEKSPDDILILPQYNQVALTGFERGPYSISVGYLYPLFGIQANGIFREILSGNGFPIIKIKYTTGSSQISAVASQMNQAVLDPNDNNINLIYADEMSQQAAMSTRSEMLMDQIDAFEFRSRYLRINLDFDMGGELTLGLSEVILQGNYDEQISGNAYSLGFNNYITSVNLHQGFGDNVALNGYLNFFIRNYHSQSANTDEKKEEQKFSFTLAVEFIL